MKQQGGFTLIELIVVIVILGILAATALPKFSNLSADARSAKMMGLAGSLKAGMALAHGQALLRSTSGVSSVTMEDGSVIAMQGWYPNEVASGIGYMAGISSVGGADFVSAIVPATSVAFYPDAARMAAGICGVTYYVAGQSATGPTINAIAASSANNC